MKLSPLKAAVKSTSKNKSKLKSKRKSKSSISKLGDKVAKSSIETLDSIDKPNKPKTVSSQANRRIFGFVVLMASLAIAFFMNQSLWPINQVVGDTGRTTANDGGTYVEGSVGNLGNLNPIFASESSEKTVSKLIFSSLLKNDSSNQIVGDLAESWSANEDNTIFTVKLKAGLKWSDGEDINSDDIIKTYELIQHPDSESPIRNNWRGIKVTKKDDLTVTFSLANAYSPFYKSLTNPIIPEHAFNDIPPSEVRLSDFSQSPSINSGPFVFKRLDNDSQQAELEKNNEYHSSNSVGIDEFIVKVFGSTQEMIASYRNGDLSAMAGVDLNEVSSNQQLKDISENDNRSNMKLNTSVFMFLKNSDDKFKNTKVRQAISKAIDIQKISDDNYGLVYPLNGPLLSSQFNSGQGLIQQHAFDADKANKLLDEAGWELDTSNNIRTKEKTKLEFTITVQNSGIFPVVARSISKQLFDVGIKANISEVKPSELQQNHIEPRNYEAVIFGFEGSNDPDVFALWHSTQTTIGGYNLSELKNKIIDETLEAGRTRSDESLRQKNYEAFIKTWNSLAPAVPLYSPNYVYISKSYVSGIKPVELNSLEDRFNSIESWRVN